MKKLQLTMIAIAISFAIVQCSNEPDVSPKELKINMLTADVWVTESVENEDDGNLTSQYSDFTIVFLKNPTSGFDGDYLLTGGGPAFPEATGKWKFNEDLSKLFLDNGKEMEITLAETSLVLRFYMPLSGGRVRGLSGHFTFNLKKPN